MYRRSIVVLLSIALGVAAATMPANAQPTGPGVVPPSATATPYGELSAKWWQWALAVPEAQNPVFDTTGVNCAVGQSGPVWFLAGVFGGSVTRACTVPAGKALFFPVLNAVFGSGVFDCEPTAPGVCDVSVLRAGAAARMDNPIELAVTIDGVAIPMVDLLTLRVQSPRFSLTFPVGAIFGLPAGTFRPNVGDGYYVMLTPRSVGPHTIYLKGVANNGELVEVTYHLTVQ